MTNQVTRFSLFIADGVLPLKTRPCQRLTSCLLSQQKNPCDTSIVDPANPCRVHGRRCRTALERADWYHVTSPDQARRRRMSDVLSQPLVDVAWLKRHLNDPAVAALEVGAENHA